MNAHDRAHTRHRVLRALLALELVLVCACATPAQTVGGEPMVLWEDAPPPAPVAKPPPLTEAEARDIALAYDAAHTCETTARALRSKDRARGWAVMEQCILRPDFTDLETIVAPPWADDVIASGHAQDLVARVIAVRGGDVANDLRIVRKKKIPLFSLSAALAEPDSYKGRIVLMRGSSRGGRANGGGRALLVAETKVMAESEWIPAGPRSRIINDTDARDRSTGTTKGAFQERTDRTEGNVVEVLHNVSVETGNEVYASIEGDAPFLEPGTDYVLLLRFDGTREVAEGSEVDERAVATVVGFFEPEASLFARLGR
jgi:hypothetical protein